MKNYWISCSGFTCRILVNDYKRIIDACPMLKKFKYQPLENLINWADQKFGKVTIEEL